jgi:hypothetical protein
LNYRLCDATNAIWAKPVRTRDDLIVRVAIAVHWNSMLTNPAYPDDVLTRDPRSYDDYALAHVVKGILDMAVRRARCRVACRRFVLPGRHTSSRPVMPRASKARHASKIGLRRPSTRMSPARVNQLDCRGPRPSPIA